MNTDQKAFTYIDKFANRIRKLLDSRFFVECNSYSEKDKIKGVAERIIVETMMCMYHFDNWKKQPKAACKYLNDNATQEEFEKFEDNLHRLEDIITDDIKDIFNKKDSFIFLTLFDKFTRFRIDDIKFAEFLREFKKNLRFSRRNERGLLFDEIDKDLSTKDKQVIADKLDMLEKMMVNFLQISAEEKVFIMENQEIAAKDIIKEYVDDSVTDEDIELYEIIANDVSEVVEDIDSGFLTDANRPSFVALVGYAVKEDIDGALKVWLPDFEKKESLFLNQKQNYLYMKTNFEQFLNEGCSFG